MDNVKKLFIQALIEAKDNEFSKLKSEDEIEWEFSEKFENSMNKLIKKNNHIQLSTRRTVRRGLLAAIIALIVAFIGLMSVSATRKPFIEFIKKVFSQYNDISISKDSTLPVDTIETEYTLSDIPEEYKLATYEKGEYIVSSVWQNNAGKEIIFSQKILDANISIDNEHGYKELEMNGNTAYYVEDESGKFICWTDGYYWFSLSVPNELNIDIIELAKNIVEKN